MKLTVAQVLAGNCAAKRFPRKDPSHLKLAAALKVVPSAPVPRLLLRPPAF